MNGAGKGRRLDWGRSEGGGRGGEGARGAGLLTLTRVSNLFQLRSIYSIVVRLSFILPQSCFIIEHEDSKDYMARMLAVANATQC